jgi:hypothetical protein
MLGAACNACMPSAVKHVHITCTTFASTTRKAWCSTRVVHTTVVHMTKQPRSQPHLKGVASSDQEVQQHSHSPCIHSLSIVWQCRLLVALLLLHLGPHHLFDTRRNDQVAAEAVAEAVAVAVAEGHAV